MLVQHGQARTGRADRRLAWTLAAVAGALNAAVFDATGLFSANMTGNVSTLADQAGQGRVAPAAIYLALVAAFVAGAAGSTLLVNAGRRRRLAGIYAFSIGAEALLLALLGCADLWLGAPARRPVLAFGLSFLMGLQNALVTRISDARVRTTHVTGMVTDIGIGLANLVDLARHPGQEAEAASNLARLRLHVQTVAAFAAGGVAGVAGYRAAGPLLLFAAAALLLALSAQGLLSARGSPSPDLEPPARSAYDPTIRPVERPREDT